MCMDLMYSNMFVNKYYWKLCCVSGSKLDPYSATSWVQIHKYEKDLTDWQKFIVVIQNFLNVPSFYSFKFFWMNKLLIKKTFFKIFIIFKIDYETVFFDPNIMYLARILLLETISIKNNHLPMIKLKGDVSQDFSSSPWYTHEH